MVAGGRRLGHRGLAFSVEARQQHRRLHLGGRHRQRVMDTFQGLATVNAHRRAAAFTGVDARAHFPQRAGDPLHGPLGQGFIAGQFGVERLTGEQAGEQPHGGAGVAHVERFSRRLKAVQADPVHDHLTVVGAFDQHPHVAERLQRGQGVLPFQKPLHGGGALGQGRQHDGPVGHGFITRHPQPAVKPAAGARQEGGVGLLCHACLVVGMPGAGVGSAPVHGQKVGPGGVGPGHDAHQGLVVVVLDGVLEAIDTVPEQGQRFQHRLPILAEDVVPHHRVGAGDAGKVAKAAGGVAENLGGIALPGQGVDQRERQQMRQVAGFRQHPVMVVRRHLQHLRPHRRPQGPHPRRGGGVGIRGGRQDHPVLAIQPGVGGFHAAFFLAGDRVARHEARKMIAQSLAGLVDHRAFDAAAVGDDGALGEPRAQGFEYRSHGRHRRRHEHQIGAAHRHR